MKQFFLDLYAKLMALTDANGEPLIKHVRMWNNQVELVMAGKMELFAYPAVFIEFNSTNIMQLGNSVQLFEPFDFVLHIVDWQLNDTSTEFLGDQSFEQNLVVYDLKQEVFKAVQKWRDNNAKVSSCIRIGEVQDYNHAGVYHYIQQWRTTLTDASTNEVEGALQTAPPLALDEVVNYNEANNPHTFSTSNADEAYPPPPPPIEFPVFPNNE